MKKLAGFAILAGMLMVFSIAAHGESGIEINYNKVTYTIEQASSAQNELPFNVKTENGVTEFSYKDGTLNATIEYDALNDSSFDMLRKYFNDSISSNDDLFLKYADLQKSYISAMQEMYNTGFLYGDKDNPESGSCMKMFYESRQEFSGQAADVFLYNIAQPDSISFKEETHMDLVIPVPSQFTFIGIKLVFGSGSLNPAAINKITGFLDCLSFTGLPAQKERLDVFTDKKAIDASNAGIYAAAAGNTGPYAVLEDAGACFKLSYPSAFVPYLQNNIGGKLFYKSFKITPNHTFSITEEPVETGAGVEDRISLIKETNNSITIKEEGKANISGNEFNYLKYDITTGGSVFHMCDYFATDGARLYRLQLSSRIEEPSAAISGEFESILSSLELSAQANKVTSPDLSGQADKQTPEGPFRQTDKQMPAGKEFTSYQNTEEGYCFSYPKDWQLEDISDDINYDKLRLTLPGMSGPINVYMAEGELYPGCNIKEIAANLSGESDKYLKKYTPPYGGTVKKVLDISYTVKDSVIYLQKLVNYVDSNGRSRLCYSTDIIKGVKIYSMFAVVGEYMSNNGEIADPGINDSVNSIISSFQLVNTDESKAREAKGETRNRKVVFIEDYLKSILDPKLTITSAAGTSGSCYVTVDNTAENGYYNISLDYTAKKIKTGDFILKSQILKTELSKLCDIISKRQIQSTEVNEKDMTVTISSSDSSNMPLITRVYGVIVGFSEKGVQWETVRKDHAAELKKECKIYLDSFLYADTNIYFFRPDEFKDIETYRKNRSTYNTVVYAEFGNNTGYFTLEINPEDDSIKAVSFMPVETLINEINTKYKYAEKGYDISSYSLDGSKFIIKLDLTSKTDNASAMESLKIWYNPETNCIEIVRM